MDRAMIFAEVLQGTYPTNGDFERLQDFFGILPDGLDGEINTLIQDPALIDVLRLLYQNTVTMCIASDIWDIAQSKIPEQRHRCCLLL